MQLFYVSFGTSITKIDFGWEIEGFGLESASSLTPLSLTQLGTDMSIDWIPSAHSPSTHMLLPAQQMC